MFLHNENNVLRLEAFLFGTCREVDCPNDDRMRMRHAWKELLRRNFNIKFLIVYSSDPSPNGLPESKFGQWGNEYSKSLKAGSLTHETTSYLLNKCPLVN